MLLAMFANNDTCMQTQKQIRILENRLEKMYHKYNESKSRNQVRLCLLQVHIPAGWIDESQTVCCNKTERMHYTLCCCEKPGCMHYTVCCTKLDACVIKSAVRTLDACVIQCAVR